VRTTNDAQNGDWAVWRRPAAGALLERSGHFGTVSIIPEEGGVFLALWRMSAFENTRHLYRFDHSHLLVDVADGSSGRSRADPNDHEQKCELGEAGDLAAAGLTRGQARERLCQGR
jgi:hypothetical protein